MINKKLTVILIGAFLLRLISLNQSLWLDEAISVQVARNMTPTTIISRFSPYDFHPPVFYILLHYWIRIFGASEISVRMPSVIFSMVTIYFVYLIGKKISSEKTGLAAALLTAVNPLFLYYSQETRMYSLATTLLTISLYYWLKLQEKNADKKSVIFYNLFSGLSFLCFYGSIFMTVSLGIVLLLKKKFKMAVVSNIGMVLAIMIVSPLLLTQLKNSKVTLADVKNWSAALGKVTIKNLLLIPLKFSIGRISFYPKIIYWITAGAATTAVFGTALKGFWKNKLLAAVFVLPLFTATLFSAISPMLSYFRYLYLIPVLALAIGLAVKEKKQLLFVFFLTAGFSLSYLLNPAFHREDWKTLARSISGKPVYMIESVADPIHYYRPEIVTNDLKNFKSKEAEILVIPYASEIHGLDYRNILINNGYELVQINNFRELTSEEWKIRQL
ncbi:MAG TPA: glycosyltransferase family 39 protein [Patescibacteria group bacterium]